MHVAVSAVGADQPGIVAAVTEGLLETGANLEDSRMALLGGHFALVVIASLPEGESADTLRAALEPLQQRMGLAITVGALPGASSPAHADEPWVVSVYGADRPGIVARVTRLLADREINITDLATHVAGDPPVYVMVLEAVLPASVDPSRLETDLRSLATDLGVDVALHPMEPETL